jgi:hypothetical protein
LDAARPLSATIREETVVKSSRFDLFRKHGLGACAIAMLLAIAVPNAFAQYPRISPAVAAESKRRANVATERSNAAWARALPTIKEWAVKGKPYIPDADEPDDLPQATIPAFPGAQGGGMYSPRLRQHDRGLQLDLSPQSLGL